MMNYTLAYFWLVPIAASCGTVLVVSAAAGVAGIAAASKSKDKKSDKKKEN